MLRTRNILNRITYTVSNKCRIKLIKITVVSIILFCQVITFAQSPATLTIEQLQDAALERQESIHSLTVSFTSDITKGMLPGMADVFTHYEVYIKDDMLHIRKTASGDPFKNAPETDRWLSYNGEYKSLYMSSSSMGPAVGFSNDSDIQIRTKDLIFFDANLLNPPLSNGSGTDDMSLISLLKSDYASVRENTELINGRECHVVDLLDQAEHNSIEYTVWLDVERGMLPLKQHFYWDYDYSIPGNDGVNCEYLVSEVEEVQPGLWLGIDGVRKIFQGKVESEREWSLVIDRDENGKPLIAVNKAFDSNIFNQWEHVPAGTRVFNSDTQEKWIARASDLAEISKIYLASLPEYKGNGKPSILMGDISVVTFYTDIRWLGLMGISLIVSILIFIKNKVSIK